MKCIYFIRAVIFISSVCNVAASATTSTRAPFESDVPSQSPPPPPPPLDIVTLRVKPPITFVGQPLRIECETHRPDAVVWFTVDGSNTTRSTLEALDQLMRRVDDRPSSSVLWSLELASPQFVDSGVYECHAELLDQPYSHVWRSAKINILPTVANVKISTEPILMTKLDADVRMFCKVCSNDNESISLLSTAKWFREDYVLSARSTFLPSDADDNCRWLTIELVRVQPSSVGVYSCSVPKFFGQESSETYLTILDLFVPVRPSVQILSKGDALILWQPPPIPSVFINRALLTYRVFLRDDHEESHVRLVTRESFFGSSQGYIWHNLTADHFYIFEVAACIKVGGSSPKCGKLSEPTLITHFKSFARPEFVNVVCRYDNVSHGSVLDVAWEAPAFSGDEFPLTYRVQVSSTSQFVDEHGVNRLDEQTDHYVSEKLVWRHLVTPNTNYSVRICVVTATGCGNDSLDTNVTTCSTPPGVPSELPIFSFHNVDPSLDSVQLQLDVQRITEREGPIRCYRVVPYKLRPGEQFLPESSSVAIHTYEKVHGDGGHGAYVAEAFSSQNFRPVITLGDESNTNCGIDARSVRGVDGSTPSDDAVRSRRDVGEMENVTSINSTWGSSSDASSTATTALDEVEDVTVSSLEASEWIVHDGKLDPDTQYSGFVEVIVIGFDGRELKRRSRMAPVVRTSMGSQGLGAVALPAALGIICGLFAVILILAVALCVLRRRGIAGRTAGIPFLPLPSTKPIRKNLLVAAYKERHKDSDLLFQREYEMLPEYFNDRTSKASDSVDNFFKNRYPDIKAYDQTRVKLNILNDTAGTDYINVAGSDYINANYVQGFRKKMFMCAQGPLDKTVNDFWRMIWEQRVEIVAMVTGLEENGKTKCAKYWPDEGESKYDDLTVSAMGESVYGEYAVRRFMVRNSGSRGGTPGNNEVTSDALNVVQFHYLAWRDFLAPDHPSGILKFIKRIREVQKADNSKGYILVHCSAGVGRTGTLVTIDSLLDQMEDEGQVDIFHFVANIRRHRNFLVQSLTQYIFIYRALAEHAQFEDTEIEIQNLTMTVERLQKRDLSGKPLIQKEFEKLDRMLDDPKMTDVGTMEINSNKNRYDHLVPFDNNRVVLTPLPSSSNSTYINASIIQGYDRSAAYIVTQDPLESTFGQFWRMIHEHCIPIVVMLSDLADESAEIVESSKCPKYWPVVEESFDHIRVARQGEEVEATMTVVRKFLITNTKTSSSHSVTQVQFKGWSADAHVPPSSCEFLVLVEQVHTLQAQEASRDPIVVHCSGGSERSGLFVAMSILLHQATTEKRVDVFQVVSNMRTQRKSTIADLDQYWFCYNSIDAYVRSRALDQ